MLYFIYNAKAGKLNTYLDMMHKIVSPKTYPCHLCDITHGVFKIRPVWDAFVKEYAEELVFLHSDEWEAHKAYRDEQLPAVFEVKGKKAALALSAEDMEKMGLDELMAWVKERK